MDEVYFCMVLHKDEDMRHFLFSVPALQILDNQCSPLWDWGREEVLGKCPLHTSHSFTLYFPHAYQESQCTVSNREPHRGDKSLRNFTFTLVLHIVPFMNHIFVMSGTPRWIKKIDTCQENCFKISETSGRAKKCFRQKGLNATVCSIQWFSDLKRNNKLQQCDLMSLFLKPSTHCSKYCINSSHTSPLMPLWPQSDGDMSKELGCLILTQDPVMHTQFFFFHCFYWSAESQLWWCSEAHAGTYTGSYVTWAGPCRTWFYYTGPVTHIASASASFRRTLEDKQDGKEPDWTAVRQVFPPVNHRPPKCSMMRDVSRGAQGGNGWKRTQCRTCYTDICGHQLS